jgi:hypothetical protein
VLPLKLDGHDKAAQEESLSEIVSKLRDSIARSGQRMLDEYGKRIRKLESEKQTFGWNFCTFFATKVRPINVSDSEIGWFKLCAAFNV